MNQTIRSNSSSIEPPLLLSGVNYWAHRFRLRQQSDASSHSSDSTLFTYVTLSAYGVRKTDPEKANTDWKYLSPSSNSSQVTLLGFS